MKIGLTVLSITLFVSSGAYGYGYIDAHGSGTRISGIGAVSVGLGGVGFTGFGDPVALLSNPSSLSSIEGTSFSVSIGAGIGTEKVSDSTGMHDNTWLTMGNLSAGMKLGLGTDIDAGVAIARISDFSYSGTHLTYDFQPGHNDDISEIRELTVTGGMYESAAGLSVRVFEHLNAGIAAGYRFGSVEYDSSFTDIENSENDTLVSWRTEMEGIAWHAGIEVPLDMSLLGLSWSSSGDQVDSRIAAGGLFHLDSSGGNALGAEVEFADPGGRNDLNIRIFGFTSLSTSFDLRGGVNFGIVNDESVDRGADIGLSIGAGVKFDKITLNFGCSWSSCSRDSILLGGGIPDDLSDSRTVIAFGVGWNP